MASRYWVGGNATWDNVAGTKWATTSGGAGGAAVPTSADDVFLDNGAGTGNVTTSTTATHCTCKTFICTGYVGTFDVRTTVTVAGNVTLVAGMTITSSSGTPRLTITTASTITSNGVTWLGNTTISTSGTITLVGDFTTSSSLTLSADFNHVINATASEKLYCNGCTKGGSASSMPTTTGTATLVFTGGTWQSTTLGNYGRFNIKCEIQGNVTLGATIVQSTGFRCTYISGTVDSTTNSNNLIINGVCILDTVGMSWYRITTNVTVTITLISNCVLSNLLTISDALTINQTSAESLSCVGLTVNLTCTGTAKVILTGGTWSGSNTTGIANDLDLQGTITVSGNVYYRTGTLKYVSGTITTTSSTLNLTSSCTLDTNGVTWNNVTLSNTTALTYTINSSLDAALLTFGTGASTIFAGTAGFTVATLSHPSTAGGNTVTLKESITYTITAAFNCNTTRVGSTVLFTSAHGTTRANILMPNNGSNLCNVLANFTRIDASGGRTITSFGGTITDCININQFYDYNGVAA